MPVPPTDERLPAPHPRTDAGRALLALVKRLSEIQDEDAAIAWQLKLEARWQAIGHLTRERTMFRNEKWGFTHDRLRKTWQLIHRVSRNDTLFTWITYGNPRTTSPLEGDINAQIREILRRHRGTSEEHHRRAAEWFLVLHELPLERALSLTHTKPEPDQPHPPALDDTGLDADERLWLHTK